METEIQESFIEPGSINISDNHVLACIKDFNTGLPEQDVNVTLLNHD